MPIKYKINPKAAKAARAHMSVPARQPSRLARIALRIVVRLEQAVTVLAILIALAMGLLAALSPQQLAEPETPLSIFLHMRG